MNLDVQSITATRKEIIGTGAILDDALDRYQNLPIVMVDREDLLVVRQAMRTVQALLDRYIEENY